MRPFFEIRVGDRIWLDGQGWDVAELTGTNVRLRSGSSVRLLSIASLAEAAPAVIGDDDTEGDPENRWEVPAVLLVSLTARQHQQLLDRLEVLRRISEPDTGGITEPCSNATTRPPPRRGWPAGHCNVKWLDWPPQDPPAW